MQHGGLGPQERRRGPGVKEMSETFETAYNLNAFAIMKDQPSYQMPAFDARRKCAKCGYATATTTWCRACLSFTLSHGTEALHRVCQRCHFMWLEAVVS